MCFGLEVPDHAFVAMDYHLDWIHVALLLAADDTDTVHSNNPTVVMATSEDVDLIVAFKQGAITHLLLLEAKAETGWTNKQTLWKARRRHRIFCPLPDHSGPASGDTAHDSAFRGRPRVGLEAAQRYRFHRPVGCDFQ